MKILFTFFFGLCIIQHPCLAGKHAPSETEKCSDTRTLSRVRTPHPTNDLRLHPAKGETVWLQKTNHVCRQPYFGGKVFQFTYTEIAEITFAHPAWNQDMLAVAYQLKEHDSRITGSLKERNVKASNCQKDQEAEFSILGTSEQYSLFVKFDAKTAKDQPNIYTQLLYSILISAKKEGMAKVWTELEQDFDQADERLITNVGFSKDCTFTNLENGHQTHQFSLKLTDLDELEHDEIQVQWTDEEPSDSHPLFGNCFAFFLRNEQGEIQGGSFGTLHLNKTTPYCVIEALWVALNLRGQGMGLRLLELAENYARFAGALVAQLGTADYQAPELYTKKGYFCFRTLKNLTLLPNGAYSSSYGFRKKLTNY